MKIPIELPNPPEIKATGIKQWEPPIVTFECTCGALNDIEIPLTNEPVIKAFEITEHQGYLGTWIDDRFEDFSDLMSRVDFRGFKFEGFGEKIVFNQPWQWLNGDMISSDRYSGDATLVHASHVLREVAK